MKQGFTVRPLESCVKDPGNGKIEILVERPLAGAKTEGGGWLAEIRGRQSPACNTRGHGLFMAEPTCKTMERHISQQPEQRKEMKKSNRNLSPCLFVLDGGGDSISRHGDIASGNRRIYQVRTCYLPHTLALTTGGLGVVTQRRGLRGG